MANKVSTTERANTARANTTGQTDTACRTREATKANILKRYTNKLLKARTARRLPIVFRVRSVVCANSVANAFLAFLRWPGGRIGIIRTFISRDRGRIRRHFLSLQPLNLHARQRKCKDDNGARADERRD
jgi:hypothetical protein